MTAKELYQQENFEDFICEFEDKWLQYADEKKKVEAYFGSVENGLELYEKWKSGDELFSEEKRNAFPQPIILA